MCRRHGQHRHDPAGFPAKLSRRACCETRRRWFGAATPSSRAPVSATCPPMMPAWCSTKCEPSAPNAKREPDCTTRRTTCTMEPRSTPLPAPCLCTCTPSALGWFFGKNFRSALFKCSKRRMCLQTNPERESPALLVVWAYQQRQLFFWKKRAVFFARKRVSAGGEVGCFPRLLGCFCAFGGCFRAFWGCFCALWAFFLFSARQRGWGGGGGGGCWGGSGVGVGGGGGGWLCERDVVGARVIWARGVWPTNVCSRHSPGLTPCVRSTRAMDDDGLPRAREVWRAGAVSSGSSSCGGEAGGEGGGCDCGRSWVGSRVGGGGWLGVGVLEGVRVL